MFLATWALEFLYPLGLSFVPSQMGLVVLDLSPDLRVFGYTFGIALAAGVLLGLAPALQSSSPHLAASLHDDGAMVGLGVRPSRLRSVLVVVQVAVCLVLLVGAGLLARGLQHVQALDVGFRTAGVLYTEYDLRRHGYTVERARDFNHALLETAGAATDRPAALTSHVPLHGGVRRATAWPEGHAEQVTCTTTFVSPKYFETLNVPVTRGRTFSAAEAGGGAAAVIISEELAARFWPGLDPIGRRLDVATLTVPLTVVGVVRDTNSASLYREKEISLYLPSGLTDERDLHLIVFAGGDTRAMADRLRQRAHDIDADVRFTTTPLESLLRFWILPSRVAAVAALVLGALALTLATLGLYAVMAYDVTHRTREIGVRLALGAGAGDVVRLVLADGGRLLLAGIVIGIGAAVAASRVLHQFLFGVRTFDPLAFLLVPLFLAVVAIAACYIPARRAARIAPIDALRSR